LDDQITFGFIVVDGHNTSFHTLTGDHRRTIFKLSVDLPKKHGRGGFSKNRFARIREEKRGWYTSKIALLATQHFIDPASSLPTVKGLILAGSANLKNDVLQKLDPRLIQIVTSVVDVQYGGEAGFNQAIQLSAVNLSNLKVFHEQEVLGRFFEEIAKDGKYCYGVEDVMYGLTSGLVELLILCKSLDHFRYELVLGDDKKVLFGRPGEKKLVELEEWKIISCVPLVDWILEHYKEFGVSIEIVSDQTSIGGQFVKGFGGIGGLLRYETISFPAIEGDLEDEFVW